MAGKPDLSAASGIQNVIVYVSDDNFAQAYSLGQQNVQESNHIVQGDGYDVLSTPNASIVCPVKTFRDKPTVKLVDYAVKQPQVDNGQQREYYNNAVQQGRPGCSYPPLPQSGFPQNVVNDVTFHNGNCDNVDVLQQEEKQIPGTVCSAVRVRDDCTNCDSYVDQDYNKVMGGEVPVQVHTHVNGVCYDTVRLEAADSSCSSLSSSDDGSQVLQNQTSEMVVYDPNVNLQTGNVVLTVGSPLPQQPQQQSNSQVIESFNTIPRPSITIPFGWKRLLNNGTIIYISPSCTALRSPEQIKEYLLTAGTCKCGLECHFKYESVFNFDPKVIGKPYVMLPDSKSGNMTKLCNHKRKIMPIVSLDCPPHDPNLKFQREHNMKRKKRRIGLPYLEGVPVSQIVTHRDKVALNQNSDKEVITAPQQMFSEYPTNMQQQNHVVKYQDQQGNRVILGDGTMMVQQSNTTSDISTQEVIKNDHPVNNMPNVFTSQPRQVLGPNGQIIQVRGGPNNSQGNVYHMQHHAGPRMIAHMPKADQPEEHRIFISRQPNEPTGPGRPQHIQIVRVNTPNQQKVVENNQIVDRNQPKRHMQPLQPQFCNPQQYQQVQLCGPHRHIRPYNQVTQNFRPHRMLYQPNQIAQAPLPPNHQKINWQNQVRRPTVMEQQKQLEQQQKQLEHQQKQLEHHNQANICERVPPLYHHTPPLTVCQEEIKRKKVKMGKFGKSRPYRLVDGGCSNNHFSCPNIDIRHIPPENRPVMMNNFSQNNKSSSPSFMEDPSGYLAQQTALLNSTINRQTGAAGCAGFTCNSPGTICQNPQQQNLNSPSNSPSQELPPPSNIITNEPVNNLLKTSHTFPRIQQDPTSLQQNNLVQVQPNFDNNKSHQYSVHCRCCVTEGFQTNYPVKNPRTSTANLQGTLDDPVTSSTSLEKHFNQNTIDIQPIQGGTVSTSNISPMEGTSDPPTPDPPQRMVDNSQISTNYLAYSNKSDQVPEFIGTQNRQAVCAKSSEPVCCYHSQVASLVTTMASSRTVGSNTITSVLAGRTNTITSSLNTPSAMTRVAGQNTSIVQSQAMTKSPLEMVQSIVSSIQIPNTSHSSQIVKQDGVPQEHILVSSGGAQVVMSGSQEDVHVPPKVVTNEGMPPVTVSPMVTNVTSSVGTVIPAVGQQVLGQQTVLVNALPAPFVLQPGVTMTMDGVPVGQNLQLPQFVAGNLIQQQIQIDNTDARRVPPLLSPDTKKKGKKRKEPVQTVASMLQFATQQNPSVVISPQGFPQQIQMNSPQSVTATPVMQAVTIVPNKTGAPAQIIMNDQSMANSNLGAQQLITNSQSAQQINLLQPVNLINSTGVVQNFPTIHQFIVPNLGGMVVNPDGTATILQDTSNLGMQLQFQNVNGQNMLTSVQNNSLFNNGQTIFAAGPSGMVIRAPTSQGKIIQQQHSPVAQFLSPNGGQFIMNGSQFGGQLSPLVASLSPNQQVTFNSPPQQIRSNNSLQPPQQEYIHMNGQTLIVPCTLTSTIPVSNQTSNQNTTFLQQNTTIVQQQTTMLTNQGLQNFQGNQQNQQGGSKVATLTPGIEDARESPKSSSQCRQSVSTQTAVNQNVQAIITNTSCQTSTISAASPPDTTTMSPIPVASEMQSPILADTTTHTDDGLSPVPLSCSTMRNDNIRSESQSCTMAMVHCISSSEPDPSDIQNPDQEWKQNLQTSSSNINETYTAGMTHIGKMSSSPTQLVSVESSSLVTSLHYGASDQEPISSSKHFDRKKNSAADCCVVLETHHEQISLFGGGGDILNETEVDEEIEDNGEDGNGQGSEGDEDDDSNEGYLVGSLLINS